MRKSTRIKKEIIKSKVNIISISECCETIVNWSNQKKTKYISIADTHVVALSWLDSKYRKIVNSSDICTPDGAPLAWILRSYGFKNQKRVSGPDLIEKLIPFLEKYKLRVLFYGSSEKVLLKISERIIKNHPLLKAYFKSPPFRTLSKKENNEIIKFINKIKPHLIFVGLGTPKQDFWIMKNKSKINAVFIAMGAGFEYYAKTKLRAPKFMRDNSLEWLYRIYQEPKRLLKRYIFTIFFFTLGITIQVISNFFKKSFISFKIKKTL